MNILKFSKTSLTVMCGMLSFSAYGWWDQTHQLIGLVASQNISSEAYEKADKLLKVTIEYPGSATLSNNANEFDTAAGWPDAINMFHNQPTNFAHKMCHFTDLLMDKDLAGTDISYASAQKELQKSLSNKPINSISCLKGAIKTLMVSSTSEVDKAIALRYVIHIVGDIGQPLHNISKISGTSDDRGGNSTLFPSNVDIPTITGVSTTQRKLHALWDATLGNFIQFPFLPAQIKEGAYPSDYTDMNKLIADKITSQDGFDKALEISANTPQTIEDWIIDGYQVAAKYAYSDLNVTWAAYSILRNEVIDAQVEKSYSRLTHLLNAIFDSKSSSLEFQKMVYTIKNDKNIQPFILK